MSDKLLIEVFDNPPVAHGPLLVLLALARNADEETRTCSLSNETLARKSVLGERQARYCVRTLEVAGVIEVSPNAGPARVNTYRIKPRSEWGAGR